MSGLTHIDADGNAVMVDVGDKLRYHGSQSAACSVIMQAETIAAISDGNIKKGDVLSIAQLAGIMGSKKTADLIPLCHPACTHLLESRTSDRCQAERRRYYGHFAKLQGKQVSKWKLSRLYPSLR